MGLYKINSFYSYILIVWLIAVQVCFLYGGNVCVDKENNVLRAENVGDNPIMINNGSVGTYYANSSASCYNNDSNIQLPGQIQLLSGNVTVKTAMKIANNSKLLLSIKKKSWLVGKICENGKSKKPELIEDKDCQPDLCDFQMDLCKMLEKPGTYTIADLQTLANITQLIDLPELPKGTPKSIVNGKWKVTIELLVGGNVTAFKVNVPSGGGWLDVACICLTFVLAVDLQWPEGDYCLLQGGGANNCPDGFKYQHIRLSVLQTFQTIVGYIFNTPMVKRDL
uniref:Uncharacterized protein n=1 Tax=Ditylenchus dipsaci TaxID=166011 RepID=A0A915DUH6_9BILA